MRRPYLLLVAIMLAGCASSTGSLEPSESEPSAPSERPSVEPADPSAEGDEGTILIVEGGAVGGPGMSIAEALATAIDGDPVLVNGTLMMDTDGSIWLCDYVEVFNPPQCQWPRLEVENYPEGGAEWDPANASDTGLQEQDGVLWIDETQLFGEVRS